MTVKRSGLGKNLSALLGSAHLSQNLREEGSLDTRDNLKDGPGNIKLGLLALEKMVPGKYQPRRHMEDEALQELVSSIQQQGLLQPILVRKLNHELFEIIAGERRFKASKLAGLKEAPVIFHEVDDKTAMALALVENLQREGLNPIDQARAMARLSIEFSLTHQEIAQLLSKSRASVSNFLRLLSLSEDVLHLVEQGNLDMGHARSLLSLDENQQLQVAKDVIAKELSVRDTERFVGRLKAGPQQKPAKPILLSAALQNKIDAFGQRIQAKVKLKQNHPEKGALMIHYDSLESLETIMSQI